MYYAFIVLEKYKLYFKFEDFVYKKGFIVLLHKIVHNVEFLFMKTMEIIMTSIVDHYRLFLETKCTFP